MQNTTHHTHPSLIPLSDIQFWRNRKSLEGLSVRSVFFNVFQSLIVVLYVMDNETNFVVRISVVVGLFIEMWKIFKVIDVTVGSVHDSLDYDSLDIIVHF
jgi:hypothetical protein